MSRLHTGKVERPRFESAPYRPCPARREFIHGRVQPLHVSRIPWAKLITGAVMAVCTIYAISLWLPIA